jgi:GT2 family glycosyltransferase
VLSVVIPTLGRSAALPAVLRRLKGIEVLLVVDAAGTAPAVSAPVRLLRAERPGASAARNLGIAHATQPVVLFLGDDIVPARGLLAAHRAFHEARPEDTAALLGHVGFRWRTPFMRWLERGIQSDYASIDSGRAGWGHFYTSNVSVKRALLERAGGFDEDLPFLYEDLDLGRRLADLGMNLRYDPEASATHRHRTTIAGWERRMEQIGAAERAFTDKHPDVEPYFRDRLERAAAGTGRHPEARYGRRLYPAFMRGWDRTSR